MIEKLKELAKKYHDVKESIDKLNQEKKDLTDEISVLVKEQNTKTDFVSIAFIPASESLKVDTKRLKDDGLYEKYSEKSFRNASVRITTKF